MAAQTGGVLAGCCGIIVETLCINYTMFNKCCGSCESAANCCSSCGCGYDKSRASRRTRNARQNKTEDSTVHNGIDKSTVADVPPPAYHDRPGIDGISTSQPTATPAMNANIVPRT